MEAITTKPIIWPFSACEVREYPHEDAHGYLETVWPDGEKCGATRGTEMYNLDYARHLGYTGVRDALREHELAHTFIAEKLGYEYSPTLRAVALKYAPGTAPYELQLAEEAVVLGFQLYLQTGRIGLGFSPYAWRAAEWGEEFRARFCAGVGSR